MRSVVVFTAVVAGIGALGTFAFVRLVGTLEQLRAIDVAPASASGVALPPSRAIAPQLSETPPEPTELMELAEASVPRADSGDEHIKEWLASDAGFQRAASELLNDPDPQVQAEARELLRELGASEAGTDLFFAVLGGYRSIFWREEGTDFEAVQEK